MKVFKVEFILKKNESVSIMFGFVVAKNAVDAESVAEILASDLLKLSLDDYTTWAVEEAEEDDAS